MLSVLFYVEAKRSKTGRFARSGKFSREVGPRKRELERGLARATEYPGYILIERLIDRPT